MAGELRRSARNRNKSSAVNSSEGDPLLRERPKQVPRKFTRGLHGFIRLINDNLKVILVVTFGIAFPTLFVSVFYHYFWLPGRGAVIDQELKRVVTPLNSPKMMDLPQVF